MMKRWIDVPMPERIARLPTGPNGFPVPWFVKDPADFRVVDFEKIPLAIGKSRCWICGEPLGTFRGWSFGALCALQKISTEPPSHVGCAEYAMEVCPFLANPAFRRSPRSFAPGSEDHLLLEDARMDTENRGLHCIYITKSPNHVRSIDVRSSVLMLGPAVATHWYLSGRIATEAEVNDGLQVARDLCAARGIKLK